MYLTSQRRRVFSSSVSFRLPKDTKDAPAVFLMNVHDTVAVGINPSFLLIQLGHRGALTEIGEISKCLSKADFLEFKSSSSTGISAMQGVKVLGSEGAA